ncbi:MAG: methyltransferase domain-containing protein [Leptolyngbyaceae cyanobacterium MO_188.B28]|nr:methyltransferase domain-containing protein [Leptolyngbyaceae cyanobacterium MO_188.B28]
MTSRKKSITRYTSKAEAGIEIGPYMNPLCPKRDGYRVTTVDVFSTEQLKEKLLADPYIDSSKLDLIEEVDIVYNGIQLKESIESSIQVKKREFKYIVSSHNFEHLPNPIKFLKDCEHLLACDGVLSMAIPISTRCFDIFRQLSSTGDLLDAYYCDVKKPSLGCVYDAHSLHAQLDITADEEPSIKSASLSQSHRTAFEILKNSDKGEYVDSHCSRFTPSSFQYILAELNDLGIVGLTIQEILVLGSEFIVHMSKLPNTGEPLNIETRNKLLKAALIEYSQLFVDKPWWFRKLRQLGVRGLKHAWFDYSPK